MRAENAALRYAATHDPLTGLLNRTGLNKQADALLSGAGPGAWAAAMVLDLNWFKQVNDLLGHAAGDWVLQEVAERLRAYGGQVWALLARMGGDEFAGVRVGAQGPVRVRAEADRLAAPMNLAGRKVAVGAAVGLAVVDAPLHLSELLRRADRAMYLAKGMQGPAAVLWDWDLDGPAVADCDPRPRLRTRDVRSLTRPGSAPLPVQPSSTAHTSESTPTAAGQARVPTGVGW